MADSRELNAAGEKDHCRSRDGCRFRSAGPSPTRRFLHRLPSPRTSPYSIPRRVENRLETVKGGGSGKMLYISNLDYRVSDDDISVLFSDVGDLKSSAIHYDKSGRSKGTAEVVFIHQSDALMAIKRYNNMLLDGKPIKIEEVGVNFETPAVAPMPGVILGNPGGSFECVPQRIAGYARDKEGGNIRFSRVAGYDSRPQRLSGHERWKERSHQKQVTAAELDADLESYHLEAKKH